MSDDSKIDQVNDIPETISIDLLPITDGIDLECSNEQQDMLANDLCSNQLIVNIGTSENQSAETVEMMGDSFYASDSTCDILESIIIRPYAQYFRISQSASAVLETLDLQSCKASELFHILLTEELTQTAKEQEIQALKCQLDESIEKIAELRRQIEELSRNTALQRCTPQHQHESKELSTPQLCDWLLKTPGPGGAHAVEELSRVGEAESIGFKSQPSGTALDVGNDQSSVDEPGKASRLSFDQQLQLNAKTGNTADWMEYDDEYPPPPYGMRSPVIAHLLSNWTTDSNKAMYLVSWVECLAATLPSGFPLGLQVVGLNTEVRDGFLMLVVPLIKATSRYPLRVFWRTAPVATVGTEPNNSTTQLFDLRVKLLVEPQMRSTSTSSEPGSSSTSDTWKKRLAVQAESSAALPSSPPNESDMGSFLHTPPDQSRSNSQCNDSSLDVSTRVHSVEKPPLANLTSSLLSYLPLSIVPSYWAAAGSSRESNVSTEAHSAKFPPSTDTAQTRLQNEGLASITHGSSANSVASSGVATPTRHNNELGIGAGDPSQASAAVATGKRIDKVAAKLAALRKS